MLYGDWWEISDSLLLDIEEDVSSYFTRNKYEEFLVRLGLYSLADFRDGEEMDRFSKHTLIRETLQGSGGHRIIKALYEREILIPATREAVEAYNADPVQSGPETDIVEPAPGRPANTDTSVSTNSAPRMTLASLKRQSLEKQRSALSEEYAAANRQLTYTHNEADRLRIGRQVESLEEQIGQAEARLAELTSDAPVVLSETSVELSATTVWASQDETPTSEWDVFISYASEDRDAVAAPLAHALNERGLHVWYDKFALKVGDSLFGGISLGLKRARHGIVALSPAFFAKEWTKRELSALFSRMTRTGQQRFALPVWYDVGVEDVANYSPLLADMVAARWEDGLASVVDQLLEAMGSENSGPVVTSAVVRAQLEEALRQPDYPDSMPDLGGVGPTTPSCRRCGERFSMCARWLYCGFARWSNSYA